MLSRSATSSRRRAHVRCRRRTAEAIRYWVYSLHPAFEASGRGAVAELRRCESGLRTWRADPGEYYHQSAGELGVMWRYRGRYLRSVAGTGVAAQEFDISMYFTRTKDSFDPWVSLTFEGRGADERTTSGCPAAARPAFILADVGRRRVTSRRQWSPFGLPVRFDGGSGVVRPPAGDERLGGSGPSAEKRSSTFLTRRATLLSPSLHGSEPTKAIELKAKQEPQFGVFMEGDVGADPRCCVPSLPGLACLLVFGDQEVASVCRPAEVATVRT